MDGIFTKNNLRNDNIPINFNEAKQIAKDGGTGNIRITEASGAAFVLKEIGNAPSSGIAGNLYPFDDTDTTDNMLVDTMSDTTSDTANRITEEDSEELEEEGMSIERYNKERLSRLLETRKAMRDLEEQAIEATGERLSRKRESAKREGMAQAVKKLDPRFEAVAERLIEADLPVTESNISRIAEAVKMAGEAQFMTEASFSYLIENRLSPTASNVYKAVHSGAGAKMTIDGEALSQLKNDIDKVVKAAGFEPSEKTAKEAQSLIESGIPVTAENLSYREELGSIKDAFESGKVSDKALTEGAVATLKEGFAPKDMNLLAVIKREEIRLSGTLESANRMRALGLEPDIEAITERIEALKLKERNASKSALDGMVDEEDLKDIFEKTLDARDAVEEAGETLAARTFAVRRTITLSEISVTAKSLAGTAKLQSASASYEASATEIRRDLGDSIGKAFSGIEEMLSGMNLETSSANVRAVRMLGYNSIEITAENISEMKYYDAQIEGLKADLKPQVTAELIKRGVNPLETTVRELSEKARAIAKELGATPEERFSEYLVKLDRKHEISAEQRESYIGIYRMLYNIEKTDGAAIGALVKSGRDLTLANLLTESRTFRRGKLDVSVDDDFGELEERNHDEPTIDRQIAKAYGTRIAEETFRNSTPGKLANAFERFAAQGQTPEDITLEGMLETLKELPEDDLDARMRTERLDALRETLQGNERETGFLKEFGMEDSAVNIRAANTLLSFRGENATVKELRKRGGTGSLAGAKAEAAGFKEDKETDPTAETGALTELPDTEEGLKGSLENLELTAAELSQRLYANADLTGREANALKDLLNLGKLKEALRTKNFYDIPLADEDGIVNIHLTLMHENESRGSFFVSLEGFTAAGTVRGSSVSLVVTADSRDTANAMRQDKELEKRLENAGFENVSIAVSGGRGTQPAPAEGTAKTGKLYMAAKETVLYLRRYSKNTGETV